ncbi:uncharacterized protein [Argopecten irradians]|uniref:uncharacterized protein n=1 Tax=Argopecten irradians TaxID=31199 RepID=UPI00371BA3BF
MPRKLLPDHLFGETANSSIVRMSNEAMLQTKMKNEHERWKLLKELKQLISSERVARLHSSRELEMLKDEYTKMLACGSVYREHGFERYDLNTNRRPMTEKSHVQNNNLPQLSRQTSQCSTHLTDTADDIPGYVRVLKRAPVRRSKSDVSDMRRTQRDVGTRTRFSSIAESDISDISTTVDNNRNTDMDDLENDMEPIPEEQITDTADDEEEKIRSAISTILAVKLHALVMWKQHMHKVPERAASERPRFVRKTTVGEAPPSTNIRAPLSRQASFLPGDCKTVFSMKKFIEREISNRAVVLSSPKKDKAKFDKLIEKARLPQLIERRKTTSAIFRDFRTYKETLSPRKLEELMSDQRSMARKRQPYVLDYSRLEAIRSGTDIKDEEVRGDNQGDVKLDITHGCDSPQTANCKS